MLGKIWHITFCHFIWYCKAEINPHQLTSRCIFKNRRFIKGLTLGKHDQR
ncbi:hypothetical protein HCH_02833 [Hahella chejuensis KCTC 2396]|uniref:Uncharacterized protein n=1 Tax=Hahella chejuensis (strain KCTC 2396) TaxID=349521 RepID=Q2SIB3_HAHCH|nr:hypothetical protein HCH_02833 [Hahella chejuensis KCTC 2396]